MCSYTLSQGNEVNRVDIYHHPAHGSFRVVSLSEDGEAIVNSVLHAACVYERPSAQFHQWTGRCKILLRSRRLLYSKLRPLRACVR